MAREMIIPIMFNRIFMVFRLQPSVFASHTTTLAKLLADYAKVVL
jgi:hypothetical protein